MTYYLHKELEVFAFNELEYKLIIGFKALSEEEKKVKLEVTNTLLLNEAPEDLKTLSFLMRELISFISLHADGLLYNVKEAWLLDYLIQDSTFMSFVNKCYFYLSKSGKPKPTILSNVLTYLDWKKEQEKDTLILSDKEKSLEHLIDFNAIDKERAKLKKEAEALIKPEALSDLIVFAESSTLADFADFHWEEGKIKEGKFPLYKRSKFLLELNQVFRAFSSYEGTLPSDLIIESWKLYYREKDFKKFLQETITIQSKL
jgi:hypothetical protein